MTPEPMSYADIEAIRDEFSTLTGDYFKSNSPEFAEYTRAIIAARDAQWREMLGEPVAWFAAGGKAFSDRPMLSKAAADAAVAHRGDGSAVSPLYAIKEQK